MCLDFFFLASFNFEYIFFCLQALALELQISVSSVQSEMLLCITRDIMDISNHLSEHDSVCQIFFSSLFHYLIGLFIPYPCRKRLKTHWKKLIRTHFVRMLN